MIGDTADLIDFVFLFIRNDLRPSGDKEVTVWAKNICNFSHNQLSGDVEIYQLFLFKSSHRHTQICVWTSKNISFELNLDLLVKMGVYQRFAIDSFLFLRWRKIYINIQMCCTN